MENVRQLKTPCFMLDEENLKYCISSFQEALGKYFKQHIVGYSVKTNPLPYCLKVAKDSGCYAEVVSYQEYELALKVGFNKKNIIYNGPLKTKETFIDAIQNHAIVNIETWREIEWLDELSHKEVYDIGIRININTSKISLEDGTGPDDDSRFGFSYESGDLQKAISLITSKKNVRLVGIHTHKEPKTRSIRFYQRVMNYVLSIIDKYQLQLQYWDLGGGFFGPMPNKPTFDEYAKGFDKVLTKANRGGDCVIVEPGSAILSSPFSYICSVIDIKQHDEKIFVTTDGTRNDVDPFFHKVDYFKHIIYNKKSNESELPQVVGGLTCLEYDRLFTLPKGSQTLSVGDFIVLERVGAYTMALTPLFIHYFPTIYIKKNNGEYDIIREEWQVDDFIQKAIY